MILRHRNNWKDRSEVVVVGPRNIVIKYIQVRHQKEIDGIWMVEKKEKREEEIQSGVLKKKEMR